MIVQWIFFIGMLAKKKQRTKHKTYLNFFPAVSNCSLFQERKTVFQTLQNFLNAFLPVNRIIVIRCYQLTISKTLKKNYFPVISLPTGSLHFKFDTLYGNQNVSQESWIIFLIELFFEKIYFNTRLLIKYWTSAAKDWQVNKLFASRIENFHLHAALTGSIKDSVLQYSIRSYLIKFRSRVIFMLSPGCRTNQTKRSIAQYILYVFYKTRKFGNNSSSKDLKNIVTANAHQHGI